MAGAVYLSLETAPKEQTSGQQIADGSIQLKHLSPELFIAIQEISQHNHGGTNSIKLDRLATPNVIGGLAPQEREEHGVGTWTGVAASGGSIMLTFGNPFREAPFVNAVALGRSAADVIISLGARTATSVVIYWSLTSGTLTTLDISWIALGR